MGGKTWQTEEEHFFWKVVVPQSPESVEPSERRLSWKECAELMRQELGHRSHRGYNKQLLYEHFYQNCKSKRPSPRARGFVREYLAQRGSIPVERPKFLRNSRQLPQRNPPVAGAAASLDTGTQLHETNSTVSSLDRKQAGERIPLPASAPAGSMAQAQPGPALSASEHARRLPRIPPLMSNTSQVASKADQLAATNRHALSETSSRACPVLHPPPNTTAGSDIVPRKQHGRLFEALLLATSASSEEPSPHSSSDSRSVSISSTAITVAEDGNGAGAVADANSKGLAM